MFLFKGLAYVATWCLLLWANGTEWMQFMQFVYGVATSTEIAYYTYIYAKVRKMYIVWKKDFSNIFILFAICG